MSRKRRAASFSGGATRLGKSIVRNASKSMEKSMISQAKSLYDDPLQVLPIYSDKESTKRFKKLKKQLEKINDNKDDIKILEKRSKKRTLDAAVAGTLLIAHNKKAPFLAIAKLPFGTVHYAQRGQAPKEYLIAAQHTDDPFFRIFGIRDIALKYHLHVYSWDKGFISTGLTANPPQEFIDFVLNKLEFSKTKNIVHCSHLSNKEITNNIISKEPYLHIHWKSADIHIGICKQCASKKDNTIFLLTKYILADDIDEDYVVSVIGSILQDESKTNIDETYFADDYLEGKLNDFKFIKKNMDIRLDNLEEKEQKLYMLNGTQFDDAKEFINALNPNDYEKRALEKLVTLYHKPIIISDATPNDVLVLFWDKFGKDIINDITKDESLSDKILSLSESPSVMIKTAIDIKNKQKVINDLPTYQSLPEIASYADKLARIYRVEGKEKLFSALRSPPQHPKKRAIAYSMLLVIRKETDMKWKFSKIEIESGEFIKPHVESLLKGKAKDYHESLEQMFKASGFSESLDDYKKE